MLHEGWGGVLVAHRVRCAVIKISCGSTERHCRKFGAVCFEKGNFMYTYINIYKYIYI